MSYYTHIMIISWFILLIFIAVLYSNIGIKRNTRQSFVRVAVLILLASSFEWIGACINGIEVSSLYFFHYTTNFIELSIAPFVPYAAAKVFSAKQRRTKRIDNLVFLVLLLHVFLEFLSLKYQFVFSVTLQNQLVYGKYYFVPLLAFIVSTLYFLWKAYIFSNYYQNKHQYLLLIIIGFVIIGITFQFINTEVLTVWIVLSIALLLIYIYYNELFMYVDLLTSLLNQFCYINTLEQASHELFIITFDVDNFKEVNDTYGHNCGDRMLKIIGQELKSTYSEYGYVFRIGGDEFAVVITEDLTHQKINILNSRFAENLKCIREEVLELPYVSYGFAHFDPNIHQSIESIKEEADRNMYHFKEQQKSK